MKNGITRGSSQRWGVTLRRDFPLEKSERFSPLVRLTSLMLSPILFFTSTPVVMGSMARSTMGGGGAGGGRGGAANLQNAGAASAALTSSRARMLLQQTDAQVAAFKTLQINARSMMAPSGTPNGLVLGGLNPYNPSGLMNSKAPTVPKEWSGVGSLNQSGNTVTVTQSSQNAYLYWNQFNVGQQTTLNFDQSAGGKDVGNWIAFNKVMGNVSPSHIYGQITAQGQIYILNQNGILFHNGSQVNTHTLVASTLPINPNFAGDPLKGISGRGLLNNPGYQFLFSALPLTGSSQSTASSPDDFNPGNIGANQVGSVVVDQGAVISSPVSSASVGGRVMLIGSSVINNGTISTPGGQTIMAAGLQVGMAAHPSTDASLRGLDVYVGKVADAAGATKDGNGYQVGTVINNGLVQIAQGDVAMVGRNIIHNGAIDSTTTVSYNGRVDIQAFYNAVVGNSAFPGNKPYYYDNSQPGGTTGSVEIGAGSVIRILPDWSSTEKAVGSSLALSSIVNIAGGSIHVGSGATIYAPGASAAAGTALDMTQATRSSSLNATLGAGVNISAGNWFKPSGQNSSLFVLGPVGDASAGSIVLDRGATISAAGSTGVDAPFEENFLSVQLRGSELANSPLQRSGKVRGVSLNLDTRVTGTYNGQYWVGTPLGDATGFLNLIYRTVGQLTAAGGTIAMNAGDSVVLNQGSTLDVSGGWVQYGGGYGSTTKLKYQGHIVDISQATPDKLYSLYTGSTTESSAKWGVTKTYKSILDPTRKTWQEGYISGVSGGAITIQAPSMALNGEIQGTVVNGPRQIRSSPTLSTLATPSTLDLEVNGTTADEKPSSLYQPSVLFANGAGDSFTHSQITLNAGYFSGDAIGSLVVNNHDGTIVLPQSISLQMGPKGSVILSGANIRLDGHINAPGGTINVTTYDFSYADMQVADAAGTTPSVANSERGNLLVGSTAVLNTAGTVSYNLGPDAYKSPIVSDGGNISLSGYRVSFAKGSLLDVSDGGLIGASSSGVIYGSAGSIALSGGQDPEVTTIHDGLLKMDGSLKGYAGPGAQSGSLSIAAPAFQIGGSVSDSRILALSPSFFDQGGFATFSLSGIGLAAESGTAADEIPGVRITSGTVIRPVVHNQAIQLVSGGITTKDFIQPDLVRPAVSLSLASSGFKDSNGNYEVRGQTLLEQGVRIQLDPQIVMSSPSAALSMQGGFSILQSTASPKSLNVQTGSLSISGKITQIDGSLSVPGGRISLTGAGTYPSHDASIIPTSVQPTLVVGSGALISTAGMVIRRGDPLGLGRRIGSVIDGGTVNVSGNIVLNSGSLIDVSGSSGDIYIPTAAGLTGGSTLAHAVLNRQQEVANTTRVDSQGGTITLSGGEELLALGTLLGRAGGPTATGGTLSVNSGRFDPNGVPTDPTLQIFQSKPALAERIASDQKKSLSYGYFAADSAMQGGFDNLVLGGNVGFNGPVSLTMPGSIKVARGGVISADAAVSISAPYVALGQPNTGPPVGGVAETQIFLAPYVAPSFGPGSLSVQARILDVGNLLLKNIGKATLDATGGVIRGGGTFDIAGDLILRAAQIYPTTATSFTLAAYDHGSAKGSITVEQAGGPIPLPLSAAGTLSLYASSIMQNGTLVAPFGTINLGWDGTGISPIDPISGAGIDKPAPATMPTTASLVLGPKSVTSVSAIDPTTGVGITIPYGIIINGKQWIDPTGVDITTIGLPSKGVNLSGASVSTVGGSVIDLRGGGNLAAYQWISGLQGNIDPTAQSQVQIQKGNWDGHQYRYSQGARVTYDGVLYSARQAIDPSDPKSQAPPSVGNYWSKVSESYAIIAGYSSDLLPIAPFAQLVDQNTGKSTTDGDPGYTSSSLSVGDRITIATGAGLPAGTYTLLPSRYAVLPGAYLITLKNISQGNQPASVTQNDSSALVAGYRFNDLNSSRHVPAITSLYEINSPAVLAQRSSYQFSLASSFLPSKEVAFPVNNAASLVIKATTAMQLQGAVMSAGANGGRSANIDLSSPANILVGNASSATPSGAIFLDSSILSSWDAGSLLIGGTRKVTTTGTVITPSSSHVSVDNAGGTLSASDVILASKNALIMNSGSSVSAVGYQSASPVAVSGNGALVRVSSDLNALTTRTGNDQVGVVGFQIGAGANLSGASITLDSSGTASIDPSVVLKGKTISIAAGKLALNFDGSTQPGTVLNLGGNVLQNLSLANTLNLSSYSSIDFHGSGVLGSSAMESLRLRAGELLGDNNSQDTLLASSIQLDNYNASTDPSGGNPTATGGSLNLSGSVLNLRGGDYLNNETVMSIGGFQNVSALLTSGVQGTGNAKGTLSVAGNLTLSAPLITGASGAVTSIKAGGVLNITDPGAASLTPGLGASLSLQGSSVSISAPILLPSGSLSVKATTGNLTISSLLDVGGTSRQFFDVTEYTDAGSISLSSDNGNLILSPGATLNLSAQSEAGNAGNLTLNAPNGIALLGGQVDASAANGTAGLFTADLGSYNGGNLDPLENLLTSGGFSQSQNIRLRNDLNVTLTAAKAHSYTLSADAGSIRVNGTIDASGNTGGSISLFAGKSLILASGAVLDAHGQNFNNAGKGGSIDLEAGNNPAVAVIAAKSPTASTPPKTTYDIGISVVDLQAGATLDLYLGIDATHQLVPSLGQASGTLHLRAPQTTDNSDLQINPIKATITGASSINLEGFFRQDANSVGTADINIGSWNSSQPYAVGDKVLFNGSLYSALQAASNKTPTTVAFWSKVGSAWSAAQTYAVGTYVLFGGNLYLAQQSSHGVTPSVSGNVSWSLDNVFQTRALANATTFMANANAIDARVNASLPASTASLLQVNPGEEIVNSKGSLLLNNDWDLSLSRYGTQVAVLDASGNPTGSTIGQNAGFLTFRAKGDITFKGSLSDGFGDSINPAANAGGNNYGLYFAPLLPIVEDAHNNLISQSSWSYRITAGGDLTSANSLAVNSSGTVNLGKPTKISNGIIPSSSSAKAAYAPNAIAGNYQVIRTGTGDISIAAGGDIRLLNQFATIYTAGSQTTDPSLGGTFDLHTAEVRATLNINNNALGTYQQPVIYGAQYSVGGGNVTLQAGGNIAHLQTLTKSFQVPYADDPTLTADSSRELPDNWLSKRGEVSAAGQWVTLASGEVMTTSWWINFANFFEGVGALGGGNVSMVAGGNISNVDAVVPTQGRVTARDSLGNLLSPSAGTLVETGGGNITVKTGGNLDAGVYYVERGNAEINVKGAIVTNKTRDASGAYLTSLVKNISYADPGSETYLPTSFFLGKGSISVLSGGSALLGPVGNIFLLPQSLNDGLSYKNYFSSYDAGSSFSATSLGGSISFRTQLQGQPAYSQWLSADLLSGSVSGTSGKPGDFQPWLRINEVTPGNANLKILASLLPGTVSLAALGGDINLQGNLTLSPSAVGNLSLEANGSINGLYQVKAKSTWAYSMINVSDANPLSIPGILSPLAQVLDSGVIGGAGGFATTTTYYLAGVSRSLTESAAYLGSTAPSLQQKLALHDQSLLHADDTMPIRLYAETGDLSGIKLFAPKATDILAGGNIEDVSFAIQQDSSSDVSIVSAGGNLILYNASSSLRVAAQSDLGSNLLPTQQSGDIQISGPGTLEVLAGGTIDMGSADPNDDGPGYGITSIGNSRNPALPFAGADLVVAAGVDLPTGLASGGLNVSALLSKLTTLPDADLYFGELKSALAETGNNGLSSALDSHGINSIDAIDSSSLSKEQKARLALNLFYIVLRDAGRDHNKGGKPGFGNYAAGENAIQTLIGSESKSGNISINHRYIDTKNGGSITILVPGGGISISPTKPSDSFPLPGIVTEHGGGINIYAQQSITMPFGRVFTLRGGDIMIWSNMGDIAAGSTAKTVASAPPTRVILDPQSSDVESDLAGLATGGGIGVLATVKDAPVGNVDLIAPAGVIDAGDAGIRATGNLNLAATRILNADNISVGGTTTGAPPALPPPPAPNVGAASAAATVGAASTSTATTAAKNDAAPAPEPPASIISVEVLGYGGGDGEESVPTPTTATGSAPPPQASL